MYQKPFDLSILYKMECYLYDIKIKIKKYNIHKYFIHLSRSVRINTSPFPFYLIKKNIVRSLFVQHTVRLLLFKFGRCTYLYLALFPLTAFFSLFLIILFVIHGKWFITFTTILPRHMTNIFFHFGHKKNTYTFLFFME